MDRIVRARVTTSEQREERIEMQEKLKEFHNNIGAKKAGLRAAGSGKVAWRTRLKLFFGRRRRSSSFWRIALCESRQFGVLTSTKPCECGKTVRL